MRKRFVVNRHGRIVFPFNFLPHLDFSLFETRESFEALMKRDFDNKAPSEAELAGRLESQRYESRYHLLQDLALHLRGRNRYAMVLYEKRPTRWADVARGRDDVCLPQPDVSARGERMVTLLLTAYHESPAGADRIVENKVFEILLAAYRASGVAGVVPTHRSAGEQAAEPGGLACQLVAYDPDYPRYTYDDIVDYSHHVPELEALMRHAMVLHNEFPWDPEAVRITPVDQLRADDIVVVFHPKGDSAREFLRRAKRMRRPEPAALPIIDAKPPVQPVGPVVVGKQFAVMPRLEAIAVAKGERVCTNEDLIRNAAYNWSPMTVEDIRSKTGIEQRVYTERSLEDLSLDAARAALAKCGRRPEEFGAVLFCSCTSGRTMPAVSTWISSRLGMLQTHAACDILAACSGLPYGIAEALRLLQESERPVLVIGAEKFSDKVGTVRASRMLFGDAAAALVIAPGTASEPPDIEVVQTYASGPLSEVDAIVWPNPDFDNDLTVYGPEVRALVKRYLQQMVNELRALPHPDGGPGSLLDAVDLVVPHQANKTMVATIAEQAGIPRERLYFNIERVGNTSAASIPLALHDAMRDGVINRPMRVFAPGFGAGATAGYIVMRMSPAML